MKFNDFWRSFNKIADNKATLEHLIICSKISKFFFYKFPAFIIYKQQWSKPGNENLEVLWKIGKFQIIDRIMLGSKCDNYILPTITLGTKVLHFVSLNESEWIVCKTTRAKSQLGFPISKCRLKNRRVKTQWHCFYCSTWKSNYCGAAPLEFAIYFAQKTFSK